MHIYRHAVLTTFVSFILIGCARTPLVQSLSVEMVKAIQPIDVKIGISQPELYAAFEHSNGGRAAAAGCGAVPGIGILLAAACGGVAGAVDAGVNASRAKEADETIRPLKNEIVDLKFDQIITDSLTKSFQNVPSLQFAGIAVTKDTTTKAYEESFRMSTASAVMFVNVDYHISKDFSTLEVSARGLIYPRSAAARTAAGLSIDIQNQKKTDGPNKAEESILKTETAVYRSSILYRTKLPIQTANTSEYIEAWKAGGGQLLRAGLNDSIIQVTRLLAEDLQRRPGTERPSLAKVDITKVIQADLVSEGASGKLLRYPDGSLHFETTVTVSDQGAPLSTVAAPSDGTKVQ